MNITMYYYIIFRYNLIYSSNPNPHFKIDLKQTWREQISDISLILKKKGST